MRNVLMGTNNNIDKFISYLLYNRQNANLKLESAAEITQTNKQTNVMNGTQVETKRKTEAKRLIDNDLVLHPDILKQ